MPARPVRRRRRFDLLALAVVGLGAVLLLATLFTQMQRMETASAVAYPQVTQPPPTLAVPTVAFIGDSYSAGTGSSGFDTRFTTLVAAYEGWSSQSFAYGGTGYLRAGTTSAKTGCGQDYCPRYEQVISRLKGYDPTIVFVSGGRNDVGLPTKSVDAAVADFYTALRTALPKARIIVTSPVWAYTSAPSQLIEIQQSVHRAAQQIDATYLDLGEPLVDDRSLVAADHVHPNDRGHASLAKVTEVALDRAQGTGTG